MMEKGQGKKPPIRLTPWLWAIVGALIGFSLGAIGTTVQEHSDFESDKSVVQAQFFGLTVHERQLAHGAFDAVVRSWGYGLPLFFTFVGGTLCFATVVYINSRYMRCS